MELVPAPPTLSDCSANLSQGMAYPALNDLSIKTNIKEG